MEWYNAEVSLRMMSLFMLKQSKLDKYKSTCEKKQTESRKINYGIEEMKTLRFG